jgi:hypothetical protein
MQLCPSVQMEAAPLVTDPVRVARLLYHLLGMSWISEGVTTRL